MFIKTHECARQRLCAQVYVVGTPSPRLHLAHRMVSRTKQGLKVTDRLWSETERFTNDCHSTGVPGSTSAEPITVTVARSVSATLSAPIQAVGAPRLGRKGRARRCPTSSPISPQQRLPGDCLGTDWHSPAIRQDGKAMPARPSFIL